MSRQTQHLISEIRREQNYPVVSLSQGVATWKKQLVRACLHAGNNMQLALLTSTMEKHSVAFPMMNLSNTKTHAAQASVIDERKEAAADAEAELTDFQRKELAELDVEYVGVDRYGVPENDAGTKARAKVWEWMCKSIHGTWAAPYERDSRIKKYDIACLYEKIMVNVDQGSFTQVGLKALRLFELKLGPSGSVMEYIVQLHERRKAVDDMGEDFKIPEKILMSMLLSCAAGHKDLREEAIAMNKEFKPSAPLDPSNKISLEGFCERLQTEQEIRARYKLNSGRDRVLKVDLGNACFSFRDTGSCSYGDECRLLEIYDPLQYIAMYIILYYNAIQTWIFDSNIM